MIENNALSRLIRTQPLRSPGAASGPVAPATQPLQGLALPDSTQAPGVVRALSPATTLDLSTPTLTTEATRWALTLEDKINQGECISNPDLQRYQQIADQIASQQAVVLLQRMEQPVQPLNEAELKWCQEFEANPRPAEQDRYQQLVDRHLEAQNQEEGPLPVTAEELSWATYTYQRSQQGYQVKPHEQRLYASIAERYR